MRFLFDRNAALLFSLIFCLPGCDSIHSVQRGTDNIENMSPYCIEKALKQIDGLSDIRVTSKRAKPIAPFDIKSASVVHYYCYNYKKAHNCITLVQDYTGLSHYSHGYLSMNDSSAQEKVDMVLPIMRSVDKTIANTCDIPDLNNIKEKCAGVICS